MTCHVTIFAMLVLPCVRSITKKLPCGVPHQLMLRDIDRRGQKCGQKILEGPFFEKKLEIKSENRNTYEDRKHI